MQQVATVRSAGVAIALALLGSCGAQREATPPSDAPRTLPISFGNVVVHAELATTYEERQQGLMGRSALPDTAGMLFVFAGDAVREFWMHNTPSALSIAFLDSTKTILNIEDMSPNTDDIHRSAAPARYALEVRQGWFTAKGISAGAKATFTLPPGLRIDP